ncbi:PEGA domain-containing protein [candidate division WWE3 bacterium]|nr:PEGA domain-containing protein [candidate division WWE3 bacterium]
MNTKGLKSILTALTLILVTLGIFLYTAGYRFTKDKVTQVVDIKQTGMISAKSFPEGANVYLNGELKTATNGVISGLQPGKYNLRIMKNGFVVWDKEVQVFPELATDITAVLVSQSPRLEPLTNTGAKEPTISPTLNKIAFFSGDGNAPGVWVIPLNGDALSLFRSNPYVVLEDTPTKLYSRGKSLMWSPDEKELLVEVSPTDGFYLVDLSNGKSQFIQDPAKLKQEWATKLTQKRLDFIAKLDIPEDLRQIATDNATIWAPDEKKFLYTVKNADKIEYKVYNMEKPIPVGERVESVVFVTNSDDKQPSISWYADSFHLILTEMDAKEESRGMVSLVRIDGSNKVELFNNNIYSDRVYSSAAGDKIILLTSFKSEGQTDLYTVSIR